jgi:hypothetical protein
MSSFLTIHNKNVSAMKSPAAFLFEHASKPLDALSAEMKQKLIDTGLKLNLRYIESDDLRCDCDTSTGEITVSTRFVEALWVTSYLNFIYYDLVRQEGGLTGSVEIDPQQEPALDAAMQLSEWMLKSLLDPTKPKQWPTGLPQPIANAEKGSPEDLADEITLLGLGFILLHEVAHAYKKHAYSGAAAENHKLEHEADRIAADWYFADHQDPQSNGRIKRGIGIASALMLIVALETFHGSFGSHTHPPSYERLKTVLTSTENDPVHPVFAFVTQLLPLYRSMAGGQFAQDAAPSYRDAFDKLIDELSQLPPPAP